MADILARYILPLAIALVALVLVLGLVNMLRGGSPNRSQKLMRWRVVLQFVAIVVAMAAIWFMVSEGVGPTLTTGLATTGFTWGGGTGAGSL